MGGLLPPGKEALEIPVLSYLIQEIAPAGIKPVGLALEIYLLPGDYPHGYTPVRPETPSWPPG